MLVLSDSAGGRAVEAERGYLTGYPLPSASKYVLARTWPATEVTRPGCVWTHSLLIGFADLATLSDPSGLLCLFRRPSASISNYDKRMTIPASDGSLPTTEHPAAGPLLDGLYLKPKSKIELRAGNAAADERLLLAIWMQQWPRLRRSFRFCSSVGADRSNDSGQFDVQITASSTASSRPLIPDAQLVTDGKVDERLASALQDLRSPTSLRPFLRQVGGDVPQGRSAMIALCQLHDALEHPKHHGIFFAAALDAFDLLGTKQARAARVMVLERALADVENVDERTLDFVCENLIHDEVILDDVTIGRVGTALWRKSPTEFASALSDEDPLGPLVSSAISILKREELADGIVRAPSVAIRVVSVRPDILTSPRLWEAAIPDVGAMLALIHPSDEDAVLNAIIAAGHAGAASQAVRRFGSARVLNAVASAGDSVDPTDREEWLDRIAQDASSLGGPLSSGSLSRCLVVGLAKRIDPDAVPNDYGVDPWIAAAQASGTTEALDERHFAAFLMARALGRTSHSRAQLFSLSFDQVHGAMAEESMPSDDWQMIERRLSWPMPWGEWDKCGRLREAVAETFVTLGLEPGIFARLTGSGSVFQSLVVIAAKTRDGRRYLDRVRKAIRDEPEDFMKVRAKIISKLI